MLQLSQNPYLAVHDSHGAFSLAATSTVIRCYSAMLQSFHVLRLLAALSLLEIVAASAAESHPAKAASSLPPVQVIEKMQSSILGEERRVLVRLPRRYEIDTAIRYPVLFKLDGDNGLKRVPARRASSPVTPAAPFSYCRAS